MGKVASAIGGANPYIAGGQALLNTGLGLAQMISGSKEKRNAQRALENYQRQQLENVQKDRTVSTLGSDLQREEQARLASTQISALQGAGTRGLVGGLGRVEAGNQRVNQQISADLDMQQKEIDAAIAQDQANIRGMQENRENADISALSSQYQSGKQDQNTGIGNAITGAGMLGGSIEGFIREANAKKQGIRPQQQVASTMQPASFALAQNFPLRAEPYPTSQFGQFGNGMFAQPRIPYLGYYNP